MPRSRQHTAAIYGLISAFPTFAIPIAIFAGPEVPEESLTLEELIKLPEDDLAQVDIAAMNLACAVGLPGSENLDHSALLAKLDTWARYVAGHAVGRAATSSRM